MFAQANKPNHRVSVAGRRLTLVLAAALTVASFVGLPTYAASPAPAPAATPKAPPLNERLQTQGDSCAQYRFGQLNAAARIAEPNRTRLRAAQAELAPGFNPGKAADGLLLLANYQAAMEALRPDRVLAATYLAVASAVPIDLKLIERVNGLLCISASPAVAKGVALIADAEWRQMNSAK
jgi:hypothetical protein